MRLVLAGQKSFGAAVLRAVLEAGHSVPLVVVPPEPEDRLVQTALQIGFQDYEISAFMTPERVEAVRADLIVAAHSHAFIGRKSRGATTLGAVGYHPSLLPRHRGRDAVRWTVTMGDPIAGGSVYWFNDNVDGGPLAAQDWCFVRPGETHRELWRDKLFPMGVDLLLRVLKDLDNGRVIAVPQSDEPGVASWEPSWDRPPLHRPEVLAIGNGPEGYVVEAARGCER